MSVRSLFSNTAKVAAAAAAPEQTQAAEVVQETPSEDAAETEPTEAEQQIAELQSRVDALEETLAGIVERMQTAEAPAEPEQMAATATPVTAVRAVVQEAMTRGLVADADADVAFAAKYGVSAYNAMVATRTPDASRVTGRVSGTSSDALDTVPSTAFGRAEIAATAREMSEKTGRKYEDCLREVRGQD